MIMRDLRAHMMKDMGLRNTMCQETTEPSKDWTRAGKEVTIESREGTSLAKE